MSAGGNALIAAQDRANQLANQAYGSWLDRLYGLSGQGLQAASGAAGGYTSLANLYQGTTGQRLGLANIVTAGEAGANNLYAQGGEPSAVQVHIDAGQEALSPLHGKAFDRAGGANMQPLADELDGAKSILRGPAQRAAREVRAMLSIPGTDVLDPHPSALSARKSLDRVSR